jgi:integrase/recombinase XerD
METLFDQFLLERKYLKNISPRTEYSYRNAKNALLRLYEGPQTLAELSQAALNRWIISMRQKGLSVVGCNVYIRTVNAFLRWLFNNKSVETLLVIPRLKAEQRLVAAFSPEQINAFLSWRPNSFAQQRLHMLVCLLFDTGARIEEALLMRREDVDFDNLLVRLQGKGAKHRLVPISNEMRKVLFRWMQKHPHKLVFCSHDGHRLSQRNVLRDLKILATKLGIEGVRVSPHTLRHTFAVNYIRRGGDPFRLQRILGHSTLEMTRRYVNLQTTDLQAVHNRLSVLAG